MSSIPKQRMDKAMPGKKAKPKAKGTGGAGGRASKPRKGGNWDWREQTLDCMRALILEAVPDMIEERKWKKPSNAMVGVPVWSHPRKGGIVCTGETYAKVVKLTFARGASIADLSGGASLFNSSLEGNTRRAIDIREGEKIDAKWAAAFKSLVKAAAALNGPPKANARPKARPVAKKPRPAKARNGETPAVVLLSGGNPQIAKADGDAPVQAYIAAMSGGGPGWKRELGRRLDTLIVRSVPNPPGVRKAVKWNSPFYGIECPAGELGWFLSFHVFTHYVKLTFFRSTSLRPIPPGGTAKSKDTRWIDIHEHDQLNEAQLAAWVKQAAALPGWVP